MRRGLHSPGAHPQRLQLTAPDVDGVAPETAGSGRVSTDRCEAGEQAVMGHALVTIKEAFAVAPGSEQVRLIALRHADADAYGQPKLECLLAGTWTRQALQGVA